VAGDWTKSILKNVKTARSGPSDKNCDEVNNKSVEEVNIPHCPSNVRVKGGKLSILYNILFTKNFVRE
jgi:hypothetical protein